MSGSIRYKLAALLVREFQSQLGLAATVAPSELWPAQGYWRSDVRADVMRWEGRCEVSRGPEQRPMGVNLGSWDTMTACLKKGISIQQDSGWSFLIHAKEIK